MALIDVVKWEQPGELLAWRFPNTELSTKTRVFVNESQEALLFKGGKLCDTFGPGAHTLSTDNIPILNKVVNLPFGGKSPFSAEVWFVNRATTLDVNWGTPDPIQVEDPGYGIIVPVRAFGQLGLRVAESGVFLTRLVGAMASFSRTELASHFRGIVMSRLKTAVATAIVEQGIGILEISTELQRLSEEVQAQVEPELRAFGVELVAFRVLSINVPEDDESVKILKRAKADAARRKIEGTSYPQERGFDVLEGAATNPGSGGGIAGAAAGLGVGLAAARAVSGMMEGVTENLTPPPVRPPAADDGDAAAPYFAQIDGRRAGPLRLAEVREHIAGGKIDATTPVWRDGLPQWAPARELPELRPLLPPPFEPEEPA